MWIFYFVNQMGSFIEKSRSSSFGGDRMNIFFGKHFFLSLTLLSHRFPFFFLMENKSTWTHRRIKKIKREISDKTHFKNKFMSLWKLPLKYLWIQKPWRDYRWWENRLKLKRKKNFSLLFFFFMFVWSNIGALGQSRRQMEWRFAENYRR